MNMEKVARYGVNKTPGADNTRRVTFSNNYDLKAMSTDDITLLERVEQQPEFLTSTHRGRSRSVQIDPKEQVEEREEQR